MRCQHTKAGPNLVGIDLERIVLTIDIGAEGKPMQAGINDVPDDPGHALISQLVHVDPG